MIIFLKEDKDRFLTNHVPWHLPIGIRNHLESIIKNNDHDELTGNHTTKEAWDHLMFIISKDDGKGISFNEMKRMKNWFDSHGKSSGTKQYELYGGDIVKVWVNNQLSNAREIANKDKEAKKLMGKSNSYRKEHDTDRQTSVSKLDTIPTHNRKTGEKNKKIKELSNLK